MRFNIVELHGINNEQEHLYMNRTLASINNNIVLENYQKISNLNPFQNPTWTIILVIFIPTAIGTIIYINKSLKRNL